MLQMPRVRDRQEFIRKVHVERFGAQGIPIRPKIPPANLVKFDEALLFNSFDQKQDAVFDLFKGIFGTIVHLVVSPVAILLAPPYAELGRAATADATQHLGLAL